MKRAWVAASILLFGAAAIGCRSLPSQNPAAADSAALLIQVRMSPPVNPGGFLDAYPQKIFFARVEGAESRPSGAPIESNWSPGKRIYLLNAAPGEYVAVAVFWRGPTTTSSSSSALGGGTVTLSVTSTPQYLALFSRDLSARTKIKVEPGKLAIVGDFYIDLSLRSTKDEVQSYYADVLSGLARDSTVYLAAPRDSNRGEETLSRLRIIAAEDFAETPWQRLLLE